MTHPDFPTAAQFDTGPLSWVMVEIREALVRSKTALFEAGGRAPEDQATALQHARTHLHQAHGALQMVDVDGVEVMTQGAEEALERFKSGVLKCSPDNAQTVANLYQAVTEYLEELLAGAPFQPVRLFPYYRALQEMLGAERIHPADLFFPELSLQARMPAPADAAAPDYPASRQRFERALLPYLKSTDPAVQQTHAAALRDAVAQVADAQQDAKARTFWLALQAFAELVAAGHLEGGLYVKQLFGLINLQMRRLTQGNTALPDGMLREALFFIATVLAGPHADEVSPLVLHLGSVFGLEGAVPKDYEARRYGQIDADVLARAREAMAEAKSAWQHLSEAVIDPALDAAFGQALATVAVTSDKLGMSALATLMRQLAEVANAAITAGRSEALAMEMTTALLFAEHGLEHIRHLPDDFSAHADTIAERLKALLAGGEAPDPAQWQGGIAQQMQQDDTVVALALEMKTGLRQVEKVLDEYYGDPSQRAPLQELDGVLHQLQGALAILDQDDAMRAALHVKAEVRKLASGLGDVSQESKLLDDVAQNVGALGFFVDMLAQNAAGARERFAFDAEQGAFRSVPFKKLAAAGPVPVLEEKVSPTTSPTPAPLPEPVPESSDAAVEAELLEIFITEAQEVLEFVRGTLAKPRAEAGSAENLAMLRRSFHTLKGSGRMVGLNQFADAAAGIERTMNVWLAEERPATEALFGLLEYAAREMTAWVAELVAQGISPRNADALTAAAARVQEGAPFEPPAAAPSAADTAAAAAATPPVADASAEAAAATPPVADASAAAAAATPPVADASAEAAAAVPPVADASADAAAATPPVADASADTAAATPPVADASADAAVHAGTSAAGADTLADAEPPSAAPASESGAATDAIPEDAFATAPPPEPVREPLPSTGNVIEFPTTAIPLVPPEEDNVKHIGALSIPLPLYNIYLAETDELVRLLARDFGEWRHEARRPVNPEALQAAHTLTGTSATVGFKALRDLAHALEQTLDGLQAPAPQLDHAQHDLLDFAVERIRQMLQSFALGEVAPEQPELISALHKLREELSVPPGASPDLDDRLDTLFAAAGEPAADTSAAHVDAAGTPPKPAGAISVAQAGAPAAKLDALFAAAYESLIANPPPASDFASLPQADNPAAPKISGEAARDDFDDLFDSAFDDAFAAPLSQITAPTEAEAQADAELLASAAPEAAPEPMLTLVPSPEAAPESTPTPTAEPVSEPEPEPEPAAEPISEPIPESEATPEPQALQKDAEPDVIVIPLPEAPAELSAGVPGSYQDELDADLLPVFLEEGADLLPQVGQSLRTWQRNPSDFSHAHMLQRVLHTVKGSARMAGAMRLGQHAHEIETHIENMVHTNSASQQAFEELLAHYDHALVLFEQLQHPAVLAAATDAGRIDADTGFGATPAAGAAGAAAAAEAPAATAGFEAAGAAATAATAATTAAAAARAGAAVAAAPRAAPADDSDAAARSPLVRVRADILDRLVNQAGEVSISRSRLENEVGSLRTSLADFSDNLTRLRRQLREIEMQAESQIASRMAISSDREFDPLEFDRFTRLQELTRMMAESVNDVASFHESLSRSVDTASGDLAQQARMTRDLQRDLMRVRMVPFASIAERLFRVARQSAKEMDKRVNLDIRGGAVEIDRSVLERMAAPFEHLLRNAIVHGVESRAQRSAAGKDETGELLVQVSQQGNEVVLEFSDDGAGLDLDRIRDKARRIGLLHEGEELSDADTADLIFEPGFSTADALTELAGRGVGMDIVRSEAQALGGRVDIATESGKGARFTIHLPLTLAVTQVVLLAAGGRTYALPSTLVEQVLQMKETALHDARSKGHVALQGQQSPLHYLPAMLGLAHAQPPAQRSAPVLMLRSGNERVALQVDEVVGNREVVVKNIGQQLARMPGISGATVLGSGEIVLILNPVALAQHLANRPDLVGREGGAAGAAEVPAPAAQPAPATLGSTIMVVDDSLTVRRVSQRLLEREGYRVVLAKDGQDALEQIQEARPDLMLVDIEMPRMDGFDLTRNVRGDERTRDIPIIMITSRSADKHRNYAMQLGVNAYFGKPFQEPVLLGAIEGLLADQRRVTLR
jgi:chemosensory pili system protein ChpA (sensor histidine kinase/response regulator)